ncbi:MAG TPA: hypothetical protein PKV13_08410 [Propionicimonas sp.]|nr:hypothetical protein [Propionicimonas sp.]HRA06626.1 hypothetical protein [Propionicimonas sp.]
MPETRLFAKLRPGSFDKLGAHRTRPSGATRTRGAHRLRAVGNALNLSTVLGLGLAVAGRARLRRGPDALLIAEQYRLPLPKAGAFTVGNVVVVPKHSMAELEHHHPGTMAHEATHAWQYFGFFGLPFLPAYALAAGWSWLRTGDPASANWFERNAGLVSGGYPEQPRNNAGLKRIGRAVRPRKRPH